LTEPDAAFVAELRALTTRYPVARGALLPILHRLQERRGHLAPSDLKLAGELVGVAPADVFSVVSFYTMFRQRPVGRFPIGLCRNISCWVNGSEKVLDALRAELGVGPGETTPDGLFSLDEAECLGACETAPCAEIDGRYFSRLTPQDAKALVAMLRASAASGADPRTAVRSARAERAGA
jgi:NADH:ubiquinone oxidoreductase subunit E